MKALVLAGGKGTRLRPLTHTSAKQLVPIANKPILYYGLEAIRDAGIRSVGIIVGDTAREVREAVGDGSRFGLEVTYIPQEEPLGLAHCVLIAREFLGDEPFVMYLGDNFLVDGIADLVDAFRGADHDAQILLTKVAEPRFYGVAELGPDGEIVALEEKPVHPRSDLAIVGVYTFSPAIHEAVRAIRPSARGELEITDAIRWLVDHGFRVHSHLVSGYWKDTGRLQDMLECNEIVLQTIEHDVRGTVDGFSEISGRVVIAPGALVENSVIRGPVVLGANTKISGSCIGPYTSIGEGCVLEGAEVEYSIILGESSITGVRGLTNSLIGRNVEVTRSMDSPHVNQLMVGDHSKIQVRA
ncbi:glucose-1-phosphate thymidylyltransferase [Nonomuraea cavernae]|uniref:Glucose-1-phosphate thymidylyltransferase n=1 Tax=Nonomuraea cavernae TaxID=2045107 RepID=A0A917YU44_9ACTN|nr:glucose-1-phosphate thymidylyltransferase [Nonomuraea cavernae]MCA2185155.1 glucose-1-phosphate thymidylyltransferase [Nonomuraea cavernae]GGO65578.1 glucose-1-phosphate thymidylyltransferase [Nonomuraea cavernae]